jgi:LPXTG-motif cell wall-anchored protein
LPTGTAIAAPGDPVNLTLDSAFTGTTGKLAEEQPTDLRKCNDIADGAKKDTDGWLFDQPVSGATASAYVIAFIKLVDGTAVPVLLGINADGVVEVPFSAAALAAPLAEDGPGPAPAGVSGGLLGDGADGAWLRTPTGWRLAYGVLQVGSTGSEPATFALTAVCLPAVAVPPASASPSASSSASPSAAASPSPAAGGAPTLPVTGGSVAVLAGAGLALVGVGVLLLRLRRRRTEITFVP